MIPPVSDREQAKATVRRFTDPYVEYADLAMREQIREELAWTIVDALLPQPDPEEDKPRFPEDGLQVDFGKSAPSSSNPMPEEVRAGYEERISNSAKAHGGGIRPDHLIAKYGHQLDPEAVVPCEMDGCQNITWKPTNHPETGDPICPSCAQEVAYQMGLERAEERLRTVTEAAQRVFSKFDQGSLYDSDGLTLLEAFRTALSSLPGAEGG